MGQSTKTDRWRELAHRNRRRLATVLVALVACFVAYHALWGANGLMVYSRKRAEYRELQQRLDTLRKDNERLTQQNHALQGDPAAIEREAREKLHYMRPGEFVYTRPEPQPALVPNTAENRAAH